MEKEGMNFQHIIILHVVITCCVICVLQGNETCHVLQTTVEKITHTYLSTSFRGYSENSNRFPQAPRLVTTIEMSTSEEEIWD
jgi:hypothetical protein